MMVRTTLKWPHGAQTCSTGLKRVYQWSAKAAVKCPLFCHLTTLCRTMCIKLTWTFQKWVLAGWPTSKWPWFDMSSSLADLRCWEDASDTHLHKLSRCAKLWSSCLDLWACLVSWVLLPERPDTTEMHFINSMCILQLWLRYAEIQNCTCMTSWRRKSPRISRITCLRKERSRTSCVLLAVLSSHALLTAVVIGAMWTSKRPCKAL